MFADSERGRAERGGEDELPIIVGFLVAFQLGFLDLPWLCTPTLAQRGCGGDQGRRPEMERCVGLGRHCFTCHRHVIHSMYAGWSKVYIGYKIITCYISGTTQWQPLNLVWLNRLNVCYAKVLGISVDGGTQVLNHIMSWLVSTSAFSLLLFGDKEIPCWGADLASLKSIKAAIHILNILE